MKFDFQIPQNPPTRQAACRGWLIARDVNFRLLAAAIDVCPHTLSAIISGERANPIHIKKLVNLGVPQELLPEPCPLGKPGPKPRKSIG